MEYFIRAGAIFQRHDIFYVPYNAIVAPGYCPVLSLAYFLSTQKLVIYHGMLAINSILTSLIIFPSYFILKKYCSIQKAVLGSILILALPAANVYTFSLLSENLFIVLCVFCLWFFIEFMEYHSRWALLLLMPSLLLLVLTKPLGIGIVLGCLIGYGYVRFFEPRKMKPVQVLLNKFVLGILLIIFIAIWYINKNIKLPLYFAYNPSMYLNSFFGIFENIAQMAQFFRLFINEVLYLALSSYFIFFLITLVLAFLTLGICEVKFFQINSWWYQLDGERRRGLQAAMIFFVTSSIIMVFITTVMMYTAPIFLFPGLNDLFLVMGRYVDSIVPMIFLFGIVGTEPILKHDVKIPSRVLFTYGLALCFTLLVFLICFPTKMYLMTETFPISYILGFKEFVPAIIVISSVFIFFSALFFLELRWKKNLLLFFAILFSILIIGAVIPQQIGVSKLRSNPSPIVLYLRDHLTKDDVVLMEREYWLKYSDTYWLAYFWCNCTFIIENGDKNGSNLPSKGNPGYIISLNSLNYPKVQFPLPFIKEDTHLYKITQNGAYPQQFANLSGNSTPGLVNRPKEYIWLFASEFSGLSSFETGWGLANGNPGGDPNMVAMTAAGAQSGISINSSFNIAHSGIYNIWIRSWNFNFTDSRYLLAIDDAMSYPVLQVRTQGDYQWEWIQAGNYSMDPGIHSIALGTLGTSNSSTTVNWAGVDILLLTDNLTYVPRDGEVPPSG